MKEVRLLSSEAIPQDELIDFLLQVGVEREESPHRIWDYALRKKNAIVWLDLNDQENYPDPEFDPVIENKLGALPQTVMLLHASSDAESASQALTLAIQLAERWPFVVDTLSSLARRIFTLEDLRTLQKEGHGLWDHESGIPLPEEWISCDEEYIAPWQEEEMRKEAETQEKGLEKEEDR